MALPFERAAAFLRSPLKPSSASELRRKFWVMMGRTSCDVGMLSDELERLGRGQLEMASERPRIGITMRLELETDRFYLSRYYSEAVEAAGGAPVHIALIPHVEYLETLLEGLDGILLPGSDSDVDPTRYGREPHPDLGSVQPLKDETDLLVLEAVERCNIPLLAICFGMQVLNVSRGGTLIQDIPTELPQAIKHQQGAPRDRRSHRVRLLEGSLLAQLSGNDGELVNSHHHQAIETVGSELVATAWTADGLVEALEDPRGDRFAVAVQWHPEIAWEKDEFSQAIFSRFVSAARDYADARRVVGQVSEVNSGRGWSGLESDKDFSRKSLQRHREKQGDDK